jgi:hypothetical protein
MYVIKFKGKILGAYHSRKRAMEAVYDKAVDLADKMSYMGDIGELSYNFEGILRAIQVKKASRKEVRYANTGVSHA